MLVKPQIVRQTGDDDGIIEGPWGPEIRQEKYSVNGLVTRREKLTEYLNDGKPYLVKECAVGNRDPFMLGDKPCFNMDSYSYATVDVISGELIQFGNECIWPSVDTSCGRHSVFAGDFGEFYPPHITLGGPTVNNPYLEKLEYKTIDDVKHHVDFYENELQISYIELVGLVSAFFTKWNYAYPFESFVRIESKPKRFYIPKFTYKKGISDVAGRKLYYSFLRELDDLTDLIAHVCDKEHKVIAINSYIGLFGSIIKIHDLSRKKDYILPINGTDHLQNIMTDVAVYSMDFITSESLGLLCSGVNANVTRESIDACSGLL